MLFRFAPEPTNLAERVTLIIARLCETAGIRAGKERALIPLVALITQRLSSLRRRFNALMLRVAAGLPAPRRGKPRPGRVRPAAAPSDMRLPTQKAWLIRLFGHHAAGLGAQLQHHLEHDPELAALIAAEPAAGRILRPLCHMLGLPLIPALQRPQRPKPAPNPAKTKTQRRQPRVYPWLPPPPQPPLPTRVDAAQPMWPPALSRR